MINDILDTLLLIDESALVSALSGLFFGLAVSILSRDGWQVILSKGLGLYVFYLVPVATVFSLSTGNAKNLYGASLTFGLFMISAMVTAYLVSAYRRWRLGRLS